jgi:hypothetical protein
MSNLSPFDKGAFSERAREDKIAIAIRNKREWDKGFDDGYQAAIDRYIELNKPKG